jgi:putative spermidine/putrescine transport system ATP-binding protein
MSQSVELKGIAKRYGGVVAAEDVDLTIAAGAFCTLLGPSGSGKTTLLKLIAGFEPPSAGKIAIGGNDMADVPVAKRNIGMVFQNYALFPNMTVAGNVAFPLEARRLARAEIDTRVKDALALVSLEGLGERYPRQLSGGQQQRVALARALVFNPDILLMDEPLGALDKNLRASIQLEIKRLHRRLGVTVVYVTHDQEEALYLSDRIVVLERGRVAQEGTPEDVYERPATRFVATFLGDCNLVPGRCAELSGDSVAVALAPGGRINVKRRGERIRAGDPVLVGFRPERVVLATREAHDTFAATIDEAIYLGAARKLVLRAGQTQVTALLDPARRDVPLAVGATVHVRIAADGAFLFAG